MKNANRRPLPISVPDVRSAPYARGESRLNANVLRLQGRNGERAGERRRRTAISFACADHGAPVDRVYQAQEL